MVVNYFWSVVEFGLLRLPTDRYLSQTRDSGFDPATIKVFGETQKRVMKVDANKCMYICGSTLLMYTHKICNKMFLIKI
jgi:hypothetical protein